MGVFPCYIKKDGTLAFRKLYGGYSSLDNSNIGGNRSSKPDLSKIAFAMLFPNTELMLLFIPFPIKAKYLIGAYVAYELFRGFQFSDSSNIAHFAHIGGALFGFIIVKFWQRNKTTFY
jgi:hypothetical protein